MQSLNSLSFEWTTLHESHKGQINSIAEANKVVSQISNTPIIIQFFDAASGLALDIGVGASVSILNFQESNDPPYFTSVGDQSINGIIEFICGKELTEFLLRNTVSNAIALEALDWFIENRTRPPFIEWENV